MLSADGVDQSDGVALPRDLRLFKCRGDLQLRRSVAADKSRYEEPVGCPTHVRTRQRNSAGLDGSPQGSRYSSTQESPWRPSVESHMEFSPKTSSTISSVPSPSTSKWSK